MDGSVPRIGSSRNRDCWTAMSWADAARPPPPAHVPRGGPPRLLLPRRRRAPAHPVRRLPAGRRPRAPARAGLLHRGRGGLRLTDAGATLLEHADALADRLRLAEHQLAGLADDERRELRIGAFPSALATIVPAAVSALLAGRPDLDVRLQEGRLDDLAARVRDGALHVAVAFQDASAPRRGTGARCARTSSRSRSCWPSRRATGSPAAARCGSATSPGTGGSRRRATA